MRTSIAALALLVLAACESVGTPPLLHIYAYASGVVGTQDGLPVVGARVRVGPFAQPCGGPSFALVIDDSTGADGTFKVPVGGLQGELCFAVTVDPPPGSGLESAAASDIRVMVRPATEGLDSAWIQFTLQPASPDTTLAIRNRCGQAPQHQATSAGPAGSRPQSPSDCPPR